MSAVLPARVRMPQWRVVALFVPPGGCVGLHLWNSTGSTARYDYQECVACFGRRITDLTPTASGGQPNVHWVVEGRCEGDPAVIPLPTPGSWGACGGCPYRSRCHPARQHAAAHFGEGRQYLCPFHQEFDSQERAAAAPRSLFLRAYGALQRGLPRLPWPLSLQVRRGR